MVRSVRNLAVGALLLAAGALAQQPSQPAPAQRPAAQPAPGQPGQFQLPAAQPPAAPATPAAAANPQAPAAQPQPPAANQPAGTPSSQQPATPPTPQPAAQSSTPTVFGGLSLNNVSLTEVIDLLARQLKINYILDPRVHGGVILNTYGEVKDMDTRSLLDTILRLNGAGMVQQGSIYRIVPLADVSHLPLPPETKTDSQTIPEDDQIMFNLIFLKYVTADELSNVLKPFVGEGATIGTYPPANLLLILDSRRSMRRTMDLVAMFDSDQLANQRVRVFDVKNGRPSDISKELENIEKSISLSEKNSPIKFLPIDRINTIIAVAPNPGAFVEVEKWLEKLDTPVKATAGATNNYVYRVRFGDATSIACSIQALYGQLSGASGGMNNIMMCMAMSGGGMGGMMGGMMGGGGMGGMGGGMMGGMGAGMFNPSMYGGGMPGGGLYGATPYVGGGYGASANGYAQPQQAAGPTGSPIAVGANAQNAATGTDLTGTYLGNAPVGGARVPIPRVVANPFNNTLLIQATPQDYDSMQNLLRELDVPPRQVLIEAKIYSVDLSHAFSSDVAATLQKIAGSTPHTFLGSLDSTGATNLSFANLVGKSRELLTAVQLQESESRAKELSAPAVIATDSIPASINVGTTVPTLSAEAVTGIQQGGSSLFANSVSNVSTGVTLAITARVTPSGIVTMIINQQVSAPQQNTSSNINSPAFSNKSVQTQLTVQDGDTIAIGGIISETDSVQEAGIPLLHRIPILGAAFGSRSYSKERSELIIFLTPHVIYDTNQITDASDELKSQLKSLRKDVRE